jgi:hypothetical protein
MKKVFLLGILLVTISCLACTHNGGLVKSASFSFTVDIPEGWRRLDNNQYLLITKENPFLQYVMVQNRPLGRSFKYTKKKLKKDMLPEEAAQIIIDEISSDQNILNFRVLDNAPAIIQGYDGFKILFTYSSDDGSKFKTLYYGFIKKDTFFNLRFTAADRIYFQKDIETFNQILESFKVIEVEAA